MLIQIIVMAFVVGVPVYMSRILFSLQTEIHEKRKELRDAQLRLIYPAYHDEEDRS